MGLYTEAADIIRKAKAKKASVKTLVLSRSTFPNKKQLYALVCETMKHVKILRGVEKRVGLLGRVEVLGGDEELLHTLLYDQLIGRGIKGSHNFRIPIQRYRSMLKSEYKLLMGENSTTRNLHKNRPSNELPRYVRVNLLKASVKSVISSFQEEGWELLDDNLHMNSGQTFAETVCSLGKGAFLSDSDLQDVLVFPPGTDLHDHPLTVSGEIILQDKASCFPAHILCPPEGAVVIDCCAAPGNKTSHLASLMGNSGHIFAFDKSAGRLRIMTSLLDKAGVTSADIRQQDFLRVDPQDPAYSDVGYVLVDPSCSGSGMVNRMNESTDDAESVSKDRLKSLSNFQISILKHALKFPAVQRVVYSTCSIHEEENEMVVDEVMSQVKGQFTLQEVKPEWPHRGVKGNPCWKECLRMSHDLDLTNGFFVACFDRIHRKDESENSVSNSHRSENISTTKKHKKKKRKPKDADEVICESNTDLSESCQIDSEIKDDQHPKVKNSRKRKHDNSDDKLEVEIVEIRQIKQKKQKKKKKKQESDIEIAKASKTIDKQELLEKETECTKPEKPRKRKKSKNIENENSENIQTVNESRKKSRHKKKNRKVDE